jgi:GTP-binding protein
MIPVIAIVGRPNVGKSTLFNRLTRSRSALVANRPGVTRDRQHGFALHDGRRVIIVDSGGLGREAAEDEALVPLIAEQALRAAAEADAAIWLVDGRAGRTADDEELAVKLRKRCRRLRIVVNKTEGLDPDVACAEFHAFGLGDPLPISAEHGIGIGAMLDAVLSEIPSGPDADADAPEGLPIAVVGRPNVGKSTLVNRLLGEDRMLTHDRPGTTRDSVAVPFSRRGRSYVLIDTAGVRRRARVSDAVEKLSVAKSLQAIDRARVVIAVIDAREGLTDQDLALLGLAAESGKSLIIAVNKWDGLEASQRAAVLAQIDRRLGFVDYACLCRTSALHGTGVGRLFDTIDAVGESQQVEAKPAALTRHLEELVQAHPPPLVRGRSIKLRYAHLGGHDPLRVIVHGNQTEHVPESYRRYLAGAMGKRLGLIGTPLFVEFKRGANPFRGRKNAPSKRQVRRRRRLIRHDRGR